MYSIKTIESYVYSVLFCSLAVLDPKIGHTIDVILHLSMSSVILIDSSTDSPVCQVRRLVGQDVAQQLVSTFILSRLDYCNSLLSRLPKSTVQPL